ncbi:hypothetical protein, partial [Nocardia farcinica]
MTTSGGHNPSGVTGQLLGTRIANLEDIVQRANLPGKSNSQILWIGSRQATSDTGVSGEGSGVMSTGR